jgi:L-amino acid N-acyltransferase YncA
VIGKRLLAEALRRAPALGLKTLTPGAFAHSEPGLMLAGESGFEPWVYFFPRVAEPDGAERDLVFLGLRLDTETALG